MKYLQPVIWSKGTLLTPQHLQVQDRFIESILQFQVDALHFKPWGFAEISLDREALASGAVVLRSARGIFPDGLLFDIPAADAGPDPKPLAAYFGPDKPGVDIYLSVPAHIDRGLNVAATASDAVTRFRADTQLVRDENSGGSEKPLQIARKNFRILAEGDALQGNSLLRMGRVTRSAAGILEIDPHTAPPMIEFGASEYVASIVRRLLEILAARSAELSAARRQRSQGLADFTSSDIANFWLLYTINSHLPLFRHFFEARKAHPERVYAEMLALAGSLTTFSGSVRPSELPFYDHEDPGRSFRELDEKLRLLLDTVVPSNFVALPLKLVQPSIYATAVADDKLFANTKMYLAASSDASAADLAGKGPQLIKLSSASAIEHLVRQALPGVKLTPIPQPPPPVPLKLAYQYFTINQSGPAWDAIVKARNAAAYVPGDFPNPKLELIVVLPET